MEPPNSPRANRGRATVRFLPSVVALLMSAPMLTWAADPDVSFSGSPLGIDDTETSRPFQQINISDADAGDTVTVRITFAAGRGTFPTDADLTSSTPGIYDLSARSPANAEAFLRALVFTPDSNHIPDGVDETTTFTVRATDAASGFDEASVDLTVTGVNTAPQVSFPGASPPAIDDDETGTPLQAVTITDADAGDTVTVQITFPAGRGTFPTGGALTSPSAGTYNLSALSPSDAQSFLRALVFTPVKNRISLDESETTTFTVAVTDGSGASDSDTEDQVVNPVNDPPTFAVSTPWSASSMPIPDNRNTNLFSDISIQDDDVARYSGVVGPQRVIVTATIPEGSSSFGSFLDPNISMNTNRIIVTATPANSATTMRGAAFAPTANRRAVGVIDSFVFGLTVVDDRGSAAANNGNRTVYVQSINDPPTVTPRLDPTFTPDTIAATPFFVTITDVDQVETFTLTIEPTSSQYGSISPAGPFTGTASTLATAVRSVQFTPIRNSVTGDQPVPFTFRVTDGHGGEDSRTTNFIVRGQNEAPDITGVSVNPIRATDDPAAAPVLPFPGVRVVDPDNGGLQSLSVTLSASPPSYGTLSTNSLSGTPATLTALIRNVTFKPSLRPGRVVGQTVQARLMIVANDGGSPVTNNNTIVAITSVNGSPVISNVPPATAQPILIPPPPPAIRPFKDLAILDDDMTNVVVTLTIDNPAKGTLTSLGGFVSQGSGVYRYTNLPAMATAALTNIIYELSPTFLFPPTAPGGTTFTIEAVDFVLNRSVATLSILVQHEALNHFVTRIEDDRNPGSLRHALENAANNDVVTLALDSYENHPIIRLKSTLGPLVLRRNVTLRGPGADLLTISGDTDGNLQPDIQLFHVFAGVEIDGVTLAHGGARGTNSTGGAIYVGKTGRLALRNCAVTDCEAAQWGGAIDVAEGGLLLERCFVARNRTDSALGLGGGAISLYTAEPCAFVNTTFSGNHQAALSGIGGGAIYVENFDPTAVLDVQIIHCTFTENRDASGGASSVYANVFGTDVMLRNSIFADGLAQNLEIAGGALITSAGGNVSDDHTRTVLTQGGQPRDVILLDQSSDRTDVTVGLGALDLRLRPTPGYPLQANSPAIGLAVAPNPPEQATDQRGVIRTNRNDSGALEFEATERVVLNEIHFDPKVTESDFLEFYVTRDSVPVNLSSFTVNVDGTNRHTFAAGTVVQPGQGIIVADTMISVIVSSNPPTPVAVASNGPLRLRARGRVELNKPDGGAVVDVSYVGVFADIFATTQAVAYPNNSLALAPQFRGCAYLPHSVVLGPPFGGANLDRNPTNNTSSPGADALGTPFGNANELPLAMDDHVIVGEDTLISISVLDNDLDADGFDRLVVIDLSRASDPQNGSTGMTNSTKGALVSVDPSGAPLRGTNVIYDPRTTAALQKLPEGAETTDQFYYEIIDFGAGPILEYQGTPGVQPLTIVSPGHRLTNGDVIVISNAAIAGYNGQWTVNGQTNDSFTVPVVFLGDTTNRGSWMTTDPRHPSRSSEALVTLTVIGANDPPTPQPDTTTTDEETIIRIMADAALAGSSTVFDTDDDYPQTPAISLVSLLTNDTDPDTDDTNTTLHVVGVVGAVHAITGYASVDGGSAVAVTSAAHGLADDTVILISGYGGHPFYNGFHPVSVIDSNSFSIPVPFVDNHTNGGVWAVLNDDNRLAATSEDGAAVRLEIRTDRIETSIVYNPRTSVFLNGLTVGEIESDSFYYAAQDRHGAVSLAQVTVQVSGVNDAPEPQADPSSLALLNSLVNPSNSLAQVLAQLEVLYFLPPASGTPHRADLEALSGTNGDEVRFFLADLFTTDEDTPLEIAAPAVLNNDGDVDRSDLARLAVKSVTPSREGAAVSLDTNRNPAIITYDPTTSARLNMLAREEPLIDSFEITVTDTHTGGDVTTLVAVLVVGANDTPVAQGDSAETMEDLILVLDPGSTSVLVNDSDADIDGAAPDNRLRLVPMTNAPTPGGALVSTFDQTLTYNPTGSVFLDGLAFGQSYTDRFEYVVMDGSFIFANGDLFRVEADGAGFILEVLANDRNLTGAGGALEVVAVGTPSRGGTATIGGAGAHVTYTPEVNFVGDEVFTYAVSDEDGNIDLGLVTVRVTVNQLNGNLQANADAFTVAKGQSPVLDVLANDNVLPATGAELVITRIVSQPFPPDHVVLSNNTISFVQESPGPFPYVKTFSYEVSGGGSTRDIAEVTVTVTNRENTLTIRDDAFAVQAGSRDNSLDVLANDNILPGTGAALTLDAVIDLPDQGTLGTNEAQTLLLYTPNPGFVGQDSLIYRATDGLGGTGTGVVTIAVGTLTTANDLFTVPFDVPATNTGDGVVELDVLANDGVLQGPPGSNVVLASVSPASATIGMMSVNAGGTRLLFDAAEGQQGEQGFVYTITDGSGRIAEGSVTVFIAGAGVQANADAFTVAVDSTGNTLDVLTNDVVFPNFGLPLTIVSVGSGLDGPNHGGTVQVNGTSDRLLYTPAPGFSGEETFTYVMTDTRKADTAKVVVRVTAGALSANDDAFTVFFEPSAPNSPPRQFTLSVLANDRVIPDAGQLLTITGVGIDDINATNAPNQQGSVAISADGASLFYAPQDTDGPFPYVERFTYEISDGTARRAQAVVMVTVQQRINARDLETSDDAFSVLGDSQNNVLPVLINDDVKPASAIGWAISGVSTAAYSGVIVISGRDILYTPQPGFVGTDEFTYTVSDGLGGTGHGTVRVKAGDRPVLDDVFTAISGSVDNALDVLANDAIRPETAGAFDLLSAGPTDHNGTAVALNGVVVYTPAASASYPYVESFQYVVVDDCGGTSTGRVAVTVYERDSDRDSAVLLITVHGVNDAPTITGTGSVGTITDKQTINPFPAVTIGEVDDQGQEVLTVTVTLDAGHGFLTALGGFSQTGPETYVFVGTAAEATTALRGLVYDPIENRIIVPTSEITTFTISVDDGFVSQPVTDNATTVTVIAVNDPPIISGTVSNQTVYHRWTIKPFAGVTITEVDDSTLQPLRVTVTLDDPTHGFLTSLGGFVDAGGGVYTLGTVGAGVTAATASTALRALVFVPTTNGRVIPGTPESTRFTITVEDGFAPPVIDNTTTVLAIHEFISKLLASDGAANDNFGAAVAASADAVVVGAPQDDDRGSASGAAYIYVRNQVLPEQWVQFQKLVPADGAAGDQFGSAVSISGRTIAVGARFDREATQSGSVYIFDRSSVAPSNWVQIKKIVPADGANLDEFGSAVSLDQDTVVIGSKADDDNGSASGSAYVYARDQGGANNWGQVKKLRAADAAASDQFGCSVGISGMTIIAGAPFDVHNGTSSGSAYVFSRDQGGANNWGQVKKLLPSDGLSSDQFGFTVGIARDTAVVGSRQHDHLGNDAGSAYIYVRDQGGTDNWGQLTELLQSTVLNNDQFGYSVSISRDKMVVGQPFAGLDNQSKFGAAFAYIRDFGGPTNWGVVQKLDRSDAANNDQFGIAVAIGQDTAAVGVTLDDDRGADSGSVYLYRLKYNNAPRLVTPIADQTAVTNVPFTFTLSANTFGDADVNDTLTLSAVLSDGSPLPAWLNFSPATGTFSGTPTLAAAYTIRVTATDEDGATVVTTFNLSVSNVAIAAAQGFMPIHLTIANDAQTGQALVSYDRFLNASGENYHLEISEDSLNWRAAGSSVVMETVAPFDALCERVTVCVRKTSTLQFFRVTYVAE